jgi:hypothetical protein
LLSTDSRVRQVGDQFPNGVRIGFVPDARDSCGQSFVFHQRPTAAASTTARALAIRVASPRAVAGASCRPRIGVGKMSKYKGDGAGGVF